MKFPQRAGLVAALLSWPLSAAESPLSDDASGPPTELDPITVEGEPLPEPILRIEPPYPMQARKRWEEGCVVLRFTVRPDGKTDDFAIMETKPVGVFEKGVIETVFRWRYEPSEEPRTVVEKFEFRNRMMGTEPRYTVQSAVATYIGSAPDGRAIMQLDVQTQGYQPPTCDSA